MAGNPQDDEDEYGGLDGNGQHGHNLDFDGEEDEDDIPPGPVDSLSILSKVTLALKKGLIPAPQSVRDVY